MKRVLICAASALLTVGGAIGLSQSPASAYDATDCGSQSNYTGGIGYGGYGFQFTSTNSGCGAKATIHCRIGTGAPGGILYGNLAYSPQVTSKNCSVGYNVGTTGHQEGINW